MQFLPRFQCTGHFPPKKKKGPLTTGPVSVRSKVEKPGCSCRGIQDSPYRSGTEGPGQARRAPTRGQQQLLTVMQRKFDTAEAMCTLLILVPAQRIRRSWWGRGHLGAGGGRALVPPGMPDTAHTNETGNRDNCVLSPASCALLRRVSVRAACACRHSVGIRRPQRSAQRERVRVSNSWRP